MSLSDTAAIDGGAQERTPVERRRQRGASAPSAVLGGRRRIVKVRVLALQLLLLLLLLLLQSGVKAGDYLEPNR